MRAGARTVPGAPVMVPDHLNRLSPSGNAVMPGTPAICEQSVATGPRCERASGLASSRSDHTHTARRRTMNERSSDCSL